jgi:hypothetical protein
MFGLKKKGPNKAFSHSDNCKILAADPGVEIQWSEIERGHWVAECVCGTEHYYEPVADRRVGSTRSIRRPATTRPSASSLPRPTSPCSGSS